MLNVTTPPKRQNRTWPSTSNWTKENIAGPGEVKTYDQEFVDIMISLVEEARDLLGITPQTVLIDDDLGAMTRSAATKPKLPAKLVALNPAKPGPSKSKPAPPPKPSPKSGPSTPVNRTTNVKVGSSSPGPSELQPWVESEAQGRSTTHAGGFSSTPTTTSLEAPLPSCHAQPPPIPPIRDCSPLLIGVDFGRSSVKRYASSLPALSVLETSRTQRVRKAAAIDLLIQWHESDLPVDHDPAPVAIKDFMHEPGAPTSYEELVQYITEQFHLEEFTRVFDRCIASTHYLRPEDGDIISRYQWKNRLLTADTWNSACTIAEIGGRLFIVFYTAPETVPMDDSDSDMDVIHGKTTINPNFRETPVAVKPDPDEDFEDPLQSIIPIARKITNLDGEEEDEELAPKAAPRLQNAIKPENTNGTKPIMYNSDNIPVTLS
ncbi:hypothetical protein BDD12DRAFT_847606 [Trichophaea hybrida]|nr:hypothetical protein BDD12DRAFT_847606 [Trichophaea hybrida]